MRILKIKALKGWIKRRDCAKCNKIKQIDLVTRDHDPLDKIMFIILLYQKGIKATRQTLSKTTVADSWAMDLA